MNKIASILDAIADSLEKKGFMKEAYDIDKVANTMEVLGFSFYKKVPEGRFVGEHVINNTFNQFIEAYGNKSHIINGTIRDLQSCAEGSAEESILDSYPGWGTEDFKVLLEKFQTMAHS